MPVHNVTPWWTPPTPSHSSSSSGGISQSSSTTSSGSNQASSSASQQASQASNFSQTYIPEYSQTPILKSIAKQAQEMAPEVYNWGMGEYYKNQGNIDQMMKNAMTYSSPQRIASEMGRAEAGVQQGAEAGRQNAIKDLQSFGVDPSSGRYAALDTASRVMSGAAAAGAGNQQREATMATGAGMQQGAMGASMQNEQIGYGAGAGANALLNTASQLKYSPLGTVSGGSSSSSGSTSSQSSGGTYNTGSSLSRSVNSSQSQSVGAHGGGAAGGDVSGGPRPMIGKSDAGGEQPTSGGFVSTELSPSAGGKVDDVQARLNAGEFVIPKDVAAWKGQEFFYKLMAQARKLRATAGQDSSGGGGMGYAESNGSGGKGEAGIPHMAMGGPMTGGVMGLPSGYDTAAAMGAGNKGAMTGGIQGGGGGGGGAMSGGGGGGPGAQQSFQAPQINQDLQNQGLAAAQPQQAPTYDQGQQESFDQGQTPMFDPFNVMSRAESNTSFAPAGEGYTGYGGGYG